METETRVKKYSFPCSDGSMQTVCLDQPMANLDIPHLGTRLKAVCLNGQWFFESPPSLSNSLQRDWDNSLSI